MKQRLFLIRLASKIKSMDIPIAPQIKKSYSSLIVGILLVVGMVLMAWFGIVPFYTHIKEKADSIQEYYASRENRLRQINKLPELENQYNNILTHEQSLRILLSEEKIVDFIKVLEDQAQQSQVQIAIVAKDGNGIEEKKVIKTPVAQTTDENTDTKTTTSSLTSPKKKKEATLMDSLPYDRFLHISIKVTGDYTNIMLFLHRLETLPYALDVVSVDVRTRSVDEMFNRTNTSAAGNPFSILGSGSSETVSTTGEGVDTPSGALQAVFDTVVYISKE